MSRIVLASASASRAALLRGAGIDFTTAPAGVDEAAIRESLERSDVTVDDVALILAEAKAAHVAGAYPHSLVIGADQMLSLDDRIFSKPASMEDAYRQLWDLRGRTHRLHSALACVRGETTLFRHVGLADLTMREFSREFLSRYLERAGAGVCASVGGYQLEGLGAQLFDDIDGDYFTILGLPLLALLKFLREAGEIES